jgi:hypothetical protein
MTKNAAANAAAPQWRTTGCGDPKAGNAFPQIPTGNLLHCFVGEYVVSVVLGTRRFASNIRDEMRVDMAGGGHA